MDGLKTGHTEEAGYCLVASAERDGFRLISVVMGTAVKNLVSRRRLNYCNTDLDILVDKLYLRQVSRYLKVLVKYGLEKLNLLILPQYKRCM